MPELIPTLTDPPPNRTRLEPLLPRAAEGRPLKVCMLAACPFPANHGTPGSIREMAEAVSERGHDVHVVTYHFGEDIPVRGPILHRIRALTRESAVIVGPTVRRPLYDLQLVFRAIEVVRRVRPDILHAHGYEAAIAAWLCRSATGVPVLYSGHNTMSDELLSYGFIRPRWAARALAKCLDAVVPRLANRCLPHSGNLERFFHDKGLRDRTEPLVNFGIDTDRPAGADAGAVRRRYGLGDGPVVLYAGVLDVFQRVELLLDAFATVAAVKPDARLLIVVTVPHEGHLSRLRGRADRLGLADRAVFTEPLPLSAVWDCLAAGDVAVVPRPQAPGFPIKLLNYMAAGRPCVLFASSASTGMCDRENVLLACPDTSSALADAILEVITDTDLAGRLARSGVEYVRVNHDRRAVAERVCAAYLRTIRAASPILERAAVSAPHFVLRKADS